METAWLRIACFVDPFYALQLKNLLVEEKEEPRPAYHGQFAFSIQFRCLFFSMRWIGRRRREREREAVCAALSSITKQKESSQRREGKKCRHYKSPFPYGTQQLLKIIGLFNFCGLNLSARFSLYVSAVITRAPGRLGTSVLLILYWIISPSSAFSFSSSSSSASSPFL